TGDEPFDVLEYDRRVPEFPHESTANQWFNESQFESYRRLGLHVAETAFCRDREQLEVPLASTKTFFESMRDFWYPPSPKVAEHSTAHAEEYSNIMERLRSKEELRRLDASVFPQIARNGPLGDRDEFYVCNELIQLMENVYADLDLEQFYEHPQV